MFYKNNFKTLAVCLGLILGTVACSKDDDFFTKRSSLSNSEELTFEKDEKELSLEVLDIENKVLEYIDVVTESKQIALYFPGYMNLNERKFKLAFDISEKSAIEIDGKAFKNKDTSLQFTPGIDLNVKIIAEDATVRDFTLVVKNVESIQKHY